MTLAVAAVWLCGMPVAHAACTNPAAGEGTQIYNGDQHVMQYCSGTLWIGMAGSAASTYTETDPKVGTLTSNKWCTSNAGGTAIICNQNAPSGAASNGATGLVQFSDGAGGFLSDATTSGQLFWDASNHRLGVGTATPAYQLDVTGDLGVSGANFAWNGKTFTQTANNFTATATHVIAGYSVGVRGNRGNIVGIDGVDESSSQFGLQIYANGVERVRVNRNGLVGIGTTSPDASALLDVSTTTKGFLPPRMLTAEVTAITSPADGLMVYDTDTDTIKLRANGAWVSLDAGGIGGATPAGNDGSIQFKSGANLAADAANLHWDDTNDRLGIGTVAPTNPLTVSASDNAALAGIKNKTTAADSIAILAIENDARNWQFRVDGTDADKLKVYDGTAGAFRLSIDASGNVGIGTTGPDAKVAVRSGGISVGGPFPSDVWSQTSMIAVGNSGTGAQAQGLIGHQGNHELNLFWNFYRKTDSSYAGLGANSYVSANGIRMGNAGLQFVGTDTIGTTMPPTNMMILNTGNVGIGTASPGHKLDVAGNIRATGNLLADDKLITSRYGAAGTYNSAEVQGIWSIGDGYQIDTTANNFGTQFGMAYAYNQVGGSPLAGAHQVVFTNNGVPGAAIGFTGSSYFAGNMGIGTASPAYKLDIAGTARATGNYYTNGSLYMGQDGTSTILYGSSVASQYMALYGAASNVTGASITLFGRTYSTTEGRITYTANTNTNDTTHSHYFTKLSSSGTTTALMSIRSSGNMYVYGDYTCTIGIATTVSCSSDRRLKKDIEPITNALDSVVKLQPVTFRLKNPEKNQKLRLGFIAQDVREIFPHAVDEEDTGYLTMDYAMLVAPLVEAVKELKNLFDALAEKVAGIITVNDDQSAQIEALKAANDNLATENTQLRKALDDLRERVGKLEYVK